MFQTEIMRVQRPIRLICKYSASQVCAAIAHVRGDNMQIKISGDTRAVLLRANLSSRELTKTALFLSSFGVPMDEETTTAEETATVPKTALDMTSVLPGLESLAGAKPATLLAKLLGKIGVTAGQDARTNANRKFLALRNA
jgi:hypothetical protein